MAGESNSPGADEPNKPEAAVPVEEDNTEAAVPVEEDFPPVLIDVVTKCISLEIFQRGPGAVYKIGSDGYYIIPRNVVVICETGTLEYQDIRANQGFVDGVVSFQKYKADHDKDIAESYVEPLISVLRVGASQILGKRRRGRRKQEETWVRLSELACFECEKFSTWLIHSSASNKRAECG